MNQMHANARKCTQMHANAFKCTQMHTSAFQCFQMYRKYTNSFKCTQMHSNARKCFQMCSFDTFANFAVLARHLAISGRNCPPLNYTIPLAFDASAPPLDKKKQLFEIPSRLNSLKCDLDLFVENPRFFAD